MCIEDVFDWIDKRNLVGRLALRRGKHACSFDFNSKMIVGASSNHAGEQLGQLLLYRGFVDENQLKEAFQVQAKEKALLGKVLLDQGLLSEEELLEVLKQKFQEAVWEVLSWNEGQFEFTENLHSWSEFKVRVDLRFTLNLGKKQVRRWQEVHRQIPSSEMRFWVSNSLALVSKHENAQIEEWVQQLIESIEEGLTANQIVLENYGRRFQVMSMLAELMERGVIAEDRREEFNRSPLIDSSALEAAALSKLAGGKKADAFALLGRALEQEPENTVLQKHYTNLKRSLMAELSREFLGEFCVPKVLKSKEELEGVSLNDHEKYILGRIDGRWDLLSLMRLSPMEDVEAMLVFKRLKRRGIIELPKRV